MEISFERFNSLHTDIKLSGIIEKNVLIINIEGNIDTYNSSFFGSETQRVITEQEGIKHAVFNLQKVVYISSTGIGIFASLLKFCKEKDLEMHVWRVSDKVFDIFQLLGFTSFIHFIDDLKELEEGFAKKSVDPKILPCPHCNKTVKIVKAGKFRCGSCKKTIIVNEALEIVRE